MAASLRKVSNSIEVWRRSQVIKPAPDEPRPLRAMVLDHELLAITFFFQLPRPKENLHSPPCVSKLH